MKAIAHNEIRVCARCSITACIWAFALGAGCHDPDFIDGPIDPPPPVDVSGIWSYQAAVAGAGATCEVTGMTLVLTMQGENQFNGTARGGRISCIRAGRVIDVDLPDQPVVVASVNQLRQQVLFSIGDTDWQNAGDVVENAVIGGQVLITRDFGGELGQVNLTNGSFEASKR